MSGIADILPAGIIRNARPVELSSDDTNFKLYVPIARIDEEQRLVDGYGVTTMPARSDGKSIHLEAIKGALPDWLKFGNIREMHQLSAVGVARDAFIDDVGAYLSSKIVDDTAWAKVVEGVYKGYSVGGKILKRDKNGDILEFRIDEFSLVDRPDGPNCTFDLWRRALETNTGGKGTMSDEMKKALDIFRAEVKKSLDTVRGVVKIDTLKRSLYTVEEMIRMLESLSWMRDSVIMEATKRGDQAGEVVVKMNAAVDFFSDLVMTMLANEVEKISPETAASAPEPSVPTGEAAVAAAAARIEDLKRRGTKLVGGAKKKLQEVWNTIGIILGVKAMSPEELVAAEGTVAADEAGAAAKTAKEKEVKEAADKEASEKRQAEEDEKKKKEEEEAKEEEEEAAKAAAEKVEAEKKAAAQAGDLKRALSEKEGLQKKADGLEKEIAALKLKDAPPKTITRDGKGILSKEMDLGLNPDALQRTVEELVEKKDVSSMIALIHAGQNVKGVAAKKA